MFRFIHAADLHLDSPLRGIEGYEDAPVEEIRGATRRAFDNLVEMALGETVDFVLLAGDLYDGEWKDYNTGIFLADRLGRLGRENIRVFLISGNHDAASQITRTLRLPPNVTVFPTGKPGTVLMDDLGVAVHGQGYRSRSVSRNLAAGYPDQVPGCFNIGLLHTALNGREGHEPYAPCTRDDLRRKGYDYWALGHVHNREVVSEDPWILFPGNLQGRHIRETGPKGASLVTVEDGEVAAVEHHDLDVVRWGVSWVDLSGCGGPDAVNDRVARALESEEGLSDGRILSLRLVLTGECPAHHRLVEEGSRLEESFRGTAAGLGGVWVEKILFRTRPGSGLEQKPDGETPLKGLMEAVDRFQDLPDSLTDLVPEIAELQRKLPACLTGAEDSPVPTTPEGIAALLQDVKGLLMARLMGPRGRE